MTKNTNIISIINQKGGVGKTTSTINIASYLAKAGHKVLVVDADSQANATSGLGIDKQSVRDSLYELMMGESDFRDVVRHTTQDDLDIIASSSRLASIDYDLVSHSKREFVLKQIMQDIDSYDFVLIDCPPSLGLMTVNALSASSYVLVPVQAEYYALEGLSQLLQVVQTVKQSYNEQLEILGVLITMFDKRTVLAAQVQTELDNYFKHKVFKTTIPRNIKLAEAPSFGKPIADHDKWSKGARAYKALTKEVIERVKNG